METVIVGWIIGYLDSHNEDKSSVVILEMFLES